jgi:hypothetical protein
MGRDKSFRASSRATHSVVDLAGAGRMMPTHLQFFQQMISVH